MVALASIAVQQHRSPDHHPFLRPETFEHGDPLAK
jgi:hypothetical protein